MPSVLTWMLLGLAAGWFLAHLAAKSVDVPLTKPNRVALAISASVLMGHCATITPTPAAIALMALAAITPALIFTDLETHRLPNAFTYPLVAWGLACSAIQGLLHSPNYSAVAMLACGLGAGGFFLLLNLVTRGGMGMGDVKLALAIGLTLGSQAPRLVVISLALAFVLGAAASLFAIAAKKLHLKSSLPFGPFMLAGVWLAISIWGTAS